MNTIRMPLIALTLTLAAASAAHAQSGTWKREFYGHYSSIGEARNIARLINQGNANNWRNAGYESRAHPVTRTYGVYAEHFYPGLGGGGNGPMQLINSIQGVLTKGDPLDRVRRRCHAKVYNFNMNAGESYQIDLESFDGSYSPRRAGFFDVYLRVEDSSGRQVASNDDGGRGYNSRLTFQPTRSGAYRIVATSYRSGATGNFKLSIRR